MNGLTEAKMTTPAAQSQPTTSINRQTQVPPKGGEPYFQTALTPGQYDTGAKCFSDRIQTYLSLKASDAALEQRSNSWSSRVEGWMSRLSGSEGHSQAATQQAEALKKEIESLTTERENLAKRWDQFAESTSQGCNP